MDKFLSQELRGPEITLTMDPYPSHPRTPFSRPKSAPSFKLRLDSGFIKRIGATRLPTRAANQLENKAVWRMKDGEFGSRLPKNTIPALKPGQKFMRLCEKRCFVPTWSAAKLKPSFTINALPLLSSIVANKASEVVLQPLPLPDLSRKASTSTLPALQHPAELPRRGKETLTEGNSYLVLKKVEKEEMGRLMIRLKEVRKSRLNQSSKQIYTNALLVSSSTDIPNSRPIEFKPGKGQLRNCLKSRKNTKPAPLAAEPGLEILGATVPQAVIIEAKSSTPPIVVLPPPIPLAFESAEKSLQDVTSSPLGESQDNSPCSPTNDQWPSTALNPIVVVKISQGKNVTTSHTGLSLDVDSTSVTARSTEIAERRQSQRLVKLPPPKEKTTTAPFGAMLRGKKVKETGQPGVRFLREPNRVPTPNHFLAGRLPQHSKLQASL